MAPRVIRHEVTQPLDQSYKLIPLTQGLNCLVDAADFARLSTVPWCACKKRQRFYAVTRAKTGRIVYMHRLILGCENREQGDHDNRNSLDNRRFNLRKCTHAQNNQNKEKLRRNKSGYKGVNWFKYQKPHGKGGRWTARIMANRKCIHLGYFDTALEAARAYNEAAVKYHGEFARLNLLYGCTPIA